jgi:hypothetical protein
MKRVFRIFIVIIFVLLFLIAVPKVLFSGERERVPEMTPEKAQMFFKTVGGVNAVNREARLIFDQLGANDCKFLNSQDLTNSPAISSLFLICENYSGKKYSGTSVGIFPDPENGRHIEIKFGNHWSLRRFYIFDPNVPTTFISPSNWFQVTSNIFASK